MKFAIAHSVSLKVRCRDASETTYTACVLQDSADIDLSCST
jgi:hypothetical protein